MQILALDCAGAACSAAIIAGPDAQGARCLTQRVERLRRGHAERIIPMVQDCLTDARLTAKDLTAVAATVGPGAFTGIRIGLAAALGIARAVGIPVIGVRVTDALAADVPVDRDRPLIVALDSRRTDPFCAVFQSTQTGSGGLRWTGGDPHAIALTPAAVSALAPGGSQAAPLIIGDAAAQLVALIPGAEIVAREGHCRPEQVGFCAAQSWESKTALPPTPLYLRAPDVSAPSKDRFRTKSINQISGRFQADDPA